MGELDRIVTLPSQPAMTLQPRIAVQSPGDPTARQIQFWRAVEDVIRASKLIPSPETAGMHVHQMDVSAGGTSFPGLLPSEPDLSDGQTVFIYVRGTGLFTRNTGTPGVFEFATSGDTNQDVTFGQSLEVDDVAVAVYAGRTDAPARYLYLGGSVMSITPGSTPWIWTFAGTGAGTIGTGAPGSVATCSTPATGDVVVSLFAGGISVGTLNFASGASTGTFSIASDVVISVGDTLYPVFPSPSDATLAGVSVTVRVQYNG